MRPCVPVTFQAPFLHTGQVRPSSNGVGKSATESVDHQKFSSSDDQPRSHEGEAVGALLQPLLRLASLSRYGRKACWHLFDVLASALEETAKERCGRLYRSAGSLALCEAACLRCNSVMPRCRGLVFHERFRVAEELAWSLEEFMATFSRRGWVQQMQSAACLEETYRQLLDSLVRMQLPNGREPDPKLVCKKGGGRLCHHVRAGQSGVDQETYTDTRCLLYCCALGPSFGCRARRGLIAGGVPGRDVLAG